MRQRKLKDLDERLEQLNSWRVKNPENMKGKWNEFLGNENDIFLEIGCGKGRFITNMANQSAKDNYIAIEGQGSVILRAMEKAEGLALENIKFLDVFMADIRDYFNENELAGIYLNFSDPWPKARHAKRRLTYRENIRKYEEVIRPGGFIQVKTDNDGLYAFTIAEFNELNMDIAEQTTNLHSSEFAVDNIMTEYEEKFSGMGKNINYCKIVLGGKK